MSTSLSPAEFPAHADALLTRLERALDRIADDLDLDVLRAGNVITLTFDNGHRAIVNSQEAAREIWLAARSGGFHFRWHPDGDAGGGGSGRGTWKDTRSDETLPAALARLIQDEVGATPLLDF